VSNFPGPLSRWPLFEDLRARAARAAEDARRLLDELQATLAELDRVWLLERTLVAREEHGEQAADPAGDGKATPP
jgi:hypothetical protein